MADRRSGVAAGGRELLALLRVTPRVLRLVWVAHPRYATALVGLSVLQGLQPLAEAWLAKLVLDAVAAAVGGAGDSRAAALPITGLVVVRAAVALLGAALGATTRLVWPNLGDDLTRDVTRRILAKANSLQDLAFFESPRFYDLLLRAQNEAGSRPIATVDTLTGLLRGTLSLASMLAVLLAFQPGLALALVLCRLPTLVALLRQGKALWWLDDWTVPEVRVLHYIRQWVLTGREKAKEVRLFGLGDYFLAEFRTRFERLRRRYAALRVRHLGWASLLGVVAALGSAGAYAAVVLQTVSGAISLGDFLLYTTALVQVEGGLDAVTRQLADLYRSQLFARNLFRFLELAPSMPEPPPGTKPPAPEPWRQGVELRGVGFSYPGAERPVLREISFAIRPGQTVALVGENGAGKSTLVKLLSRLYDPTAGQILLDGTDLRAYDLASWRRRLAVVFQDFVRFNVPARENIGLGRVRHVEDLSLVQAAAARSGAAPHIARLPLGYDTMLGRRFATAGHDGVDLSGGEWQRIALARAFMRAPSPTSAECVETPAPAEADSPPPPLGVTGSGDEWAQLLILDEPTAALDARAEHDLFQRFRELTRGRATLLISHRFSTVRMADRIVVLEGGRVAEQGSHEELVALGGTYADLYEKQAARYR